MMMGIFSRRTALPAVCLAGLLVSLTLVFEVIAGVVQ